MKTVVRIILRKSVFAAILSNKCDKEQLFFQAGTHIREYSNLLRELQMHGVGGYGSSTLWDTVVGEVDSIV